MSQSFTMDPDIPVPSIEHHELPTNTNTFTNFRERTRSPRASSSPNRTPFKTPLSHPHTPADYHSSASPSLIRNERRSTPNLQPKRSSSSLSVSRGQTPSRTQLRRVSSNLSPVNLSIAVKPPEIISAPPMTAGSVAKEYFERELQTHSNRQSKTVVIVHNSCYGHRFSRPRTTKAALSTIVERPERIHATLLGASTAYVRLGERHNEGAHGPHPNRDVNTLPRPPFLFKKTSRSIPLNHPAVTHVHGTKWMEELQIMCDSAESKLAINGKELQRPIGYGKDEDGNNLPKLHEGDLYLCSESLSALQGCLGGVCDAVDDVFSSSETKRAFVCIRPPGHHCSSNYPSGFCWLNNVHIGINYAAMNHGLTHAAIIDFDLHHGDGSQTITWDHNQKAQTLPKNAAQHKKTPIGYYSLHDINSYPCEWGDEDKVKNASLCIHNAHGQSIWNVHLEPWTSLDHFWQLYETKYSVLLEKTRSFLEYHSEKLRVAGIEPKAAIFLSAGFDASQWEGQGMQRHNVNVPTDFYARLTSDVVYMASDPRLGIDGRVISVLEGGYSDRALASGVVSHLCGLSGDMGERTSASNNTEHTSNGLGLGLPYELGVDSSSTPYQPQWWSEANLQALEDRVAGNIPSVTVVKEKAPGNYSSPTQASTARMTDVARERKSLSAQLEARSMTATADPRPPPPVDWIIASYELSQILIPNDRQTLSCRHDELNAEATKARRERQSAIGVAAPEPRMQLRTRAKGPILEQEVVRAASRTSNRRTTIAAVSELPDPSMPAQRPRRRSSAASSVLSSFQDMKLEDGGNSSSGVAQSERLAQPPPKELVEKKTRMAPPSKKAATRISSPRKVRASVQPELRTTVFQSKLGSTGHHNNASEAPTHTQSQMSADDGSANTDSMDDLASGMKKVSIKLKMPTPEEHLENQKKTEEGKLKKSRITKKPPLPKVNKQKAALSTASSKTMNAVELPTTSSLDTSTFLATSSPVDPTSYSDLSLHQTGNNTEAQSLQSTEITPSDLQMQTQMPVLRTENSTSIDAVSRMQYDAGPVASTTTPNPSLQTQPAEYGISTVPKKTKADLPVFTSSSPIPFARAQNGVLIEDTKNKDVPSIWDVPDTPGH